MAIIKLETNIPKTLALAFSEGKEVQSQYNGTELMFSTTSGDRIFLPPIAAQRIKEAGIAAHRPFEICRRQVGKAVEWQVKTPNAVGVALEVSPTAPVDLQKATATQGYNGNAHRDHAMTAALDATYTAMAKPAPASGQRPVVLRMMGALCAAVDAAIDAETYAAKQGYTVEFSEESIRCIANTIFISETRGGAA